MRRVEAIAQGIGLLVLLFVLGTAGIPGLAILPSLIVAGVAILAVGAACFLIVRSRLRPVKRAGVCAIIIGSFICLAWKVVKAPPEWPQGQGTVSRLTTPPCTVLTEYIYVANGSRFTVTKSKDWPSVQDAQRAQKSPLTLYYDPQQAARCTERQTPGWTRVQASPSGSRLTEHGPYKATLLYGGYLGILGATQVEFEGPGLGELKLGARVPVYVNPTTPNQFSLVPQATVGGQKFPLLGFGLALVVAGLIASFKDRKWLEEVGPGPIPVSPSASLQQSAATPRALSAREQLERIDWRQFERVVARILEHMDWQVTLSGGANPDGGADIVARKNGEIAVVQCKHWKRSVVQLKVVRELLGTKASAGFAAHEAVLFTLSSYTDEARKFGAENKITLFDGNDVTKHVEEVGVDQFPELVDPDRKFCPKCDAPMVRRESARPFWGCSTYPRCRGTIEIEML